MSDNVLPGGSIAIRIDKPSNRRIVIPALEVVEASFPVVDIPTVAQRVDIRQRARCGNDFPVRVIVVACDNVLAGVHNPHHVPLQVGDVVVHRAVVLHGVGGSIGIVEEVNGIGAPGHAHQLATGIVVTVGGAVDNLAGSQAAGIIGEAQAVAACGGSCQAPTVSPGEVPANAVVVAGGIANGVVGNGLAVKGGEQILPVGVAVGIGMPIGCQNIARTIIRIGVSIVTNGLEELTLVVVGIGDGSLPRGSIGGDVTHAVIGITIPLPAAGHGCHLHGGLGAANIPVGILTGHRAAGDGGQAPQAIVAHGQGSAHTGGHGVQAAIG